MDSEPLSTFEETVRWVRWSLAEVDPKKEQIPILQARKIVGHASYFVDFTQGRASIQDDNEVFSSLHEYTLQLNDEKCITIFKKIHNLVENLKTSLHLLEFFDKATHLIFEIYPECAELTEDSLKKIEEIIVSNIPDERIKGITKWKLERAKRDRDPAILDGAPETVSELVQEVRDLLSHGMAQEIELINLLEEINFRKNSLAIDIKNEMEKCGGYLRTFKERITDLLQYPLLSAIILKGQATLEQIDAFESCVRGGRDFKETALLDLEENELIEHEIQLFPSARSILRESRIRNSSSAEIQKLTANGFIEFRGNKPHLIKRLEQALEVLRLGLEYVNPDRWLIRAQGATLSLEEASQAAKVNSAGELTAALETLVEFGFFTKSRRAYIPRRGVSAIAEYARGEEEVDLQPASFILVKLGLGEIKFSRGKKLEEGAEKKAFELVGTIQSFLDRVFETRRYVTTKHLERYFVLTRDQLGKTFASAHAEVNTSEISTIDQPITSVF
ncbi:MAG: hypothetical protein ACFFBD_15450 [Candidatus Hodarchaeota archaeon]